MTRDWETAAAKRLQQTIDNMVSRLRATADQIEREAIRNIAAAAKGDTQYASYSRVAAQAIHELHTLLPNINASNIIDAGADADEARLEKKQAGPPGFGSTDRTPTTAETTAKRVALLDVLAALDGWIQGGKENHVAMGHRHENRGEECWRSFAPSDIRRMVNDVADQAGINAFPEPKIPQEDVK